VNNYKANNLTRYRCPLGTTSKPSSKCLGNCEIKTGAQKEIQLEVNPLKIIEGYPTHPLPWLA